MERCNPLVGAVEPLVIFVAIHSAEPPQTVHVGVVHDAPLLIFLGFVLDDESNRW